MRAVNDLMIKENEMANIQGQSSLLPSFRGAFAALSLDLHCPKTEFPILVITNTPLIFFLSFIYCRNKHSVLLLNTPHIANL